MNQRQVYTSLMVAGCVPFLIATIAPYLGVYELPIIGNIQRAIALYALAIVSFMAGTQWGLSLSPQYNQNQPKARPISPISPQRLMVGSNAMVLTPWLLYCILGAGISYYFSVAVTLVLIVLIDYRLANRDTITHDYCRIRLMITIAIVICLVSLAFTA